jgi:acetyltransferase-like isoleucine patch superfamily enzyme
VLSGIGGLEIGDDVGLASSCRVYSLSHHYRSWSDPGDRSYIFSPQVADSQQSMLQGSVVLMRNVGLAVGCLVLPGAEIGEDSFARPFSVVSGAWPANSMLGGNPAWNVGHRFRNGHE